jgi:hypothetical protein
VIAKAFNAGFVRREALWFEWGWETFTAWSSQRLGRSWGSLIREVPGRVGAALTKPGRARTARWCGFGERDREEHARNRCRNASQR